MIICAAIKIPGDIIIRGHRHKDCIRTAISDFHMSKQGLSGSRVVQGFVNSENKFLDRREAKIEFEACGQGIGKWADELYSEDLY